MKCWCPELEHTDRKKEDVCQPACGGKDRLRYSGDSIDWDKGWPMYKRFEHTRSGFLFWDRIRQAVEHEFQKKDEYGKLVEKRQRTGRDVKWSQSVDKDERRKERRLLAGHKPFVYKAGSEAYPDRLPSDVLPSRMQMRDEVEEYIYEFTDMTRETTRETDEGDS